jgi:hypothetical protein
MFVFEIHLFYGIYLLIIRHRYRNVINVFRFHGNPKGKLSYLAII